MTTTTVPPSAPTYTEPSQRTERDQPNQYSIVFVSARKLEKEHIPQGDYEKVTSCYPEFFYFHAFVGHHVLRPGNDGEMEIEGNLTALSSTPYRSSICGHLLLEEMFDNPNISREEF